MYNVLIVSAELPDNGGEVYTYLTYTKRAPMDWFNQHTADVERSKREEKGGFLKLYKGLSLLRVYVGAENVPADEVDQVLADTWHRAKMTGADCSRLPADGGDPIYWAEKRARGATRLARFATAREERAKSPEAKPADKAAALRSDPVAAIMADLERAREERAAIMHALDAIRAALVMPSPKL